MANESRLFYVISLFLFSATFMSVIFGYLGFLNYLYILPLTVAFVYIINKKLLAGKIDKKAYFFAFIFLIPILVIFLSLGVIPEQGADLYTRLSVSRIYSEEFEIARLYSQGIDYPQGTDAFLAFLIQPLEKYFVFTTFIFEIFLTYMSFVAVYKLTKLITKKSSVIPLFLYSISIFPLWILEQGYISFLFGSFFFLAFLVAIKEYESYGNKKLLAVAACFIAGSLMTYPHFGAFSLLFILMSRNKKYYKAFLIGVLIALPELISLANGYVANYRKPIDDVSDVGVFLAGFGILQGGILNPNPFAVAALVAFALLGFKVFLKSKEHSFLRRWTWTYVIFFIYVIITFSVNLFIRLRDDNLVSVKEFYMVIKMFYTFIQPVAIICMLGIENIKNKINSKKALKVLYYGLMTYHLLFGLGYAGFLIYRGAIFPVDFYVKLDDLRKSINGEPVAVEPCLVNQTTFERPYIYSSFYDLPSNWTENKIARLYKLFRTEEGGINYNVTIGYTENGNMLYTCNGINLVEKG